MNIYRRKYYQKNKERLLQQAKEWRQEHKEQKREYDKRYRLKHIAELRVKRRIAAQIRRKEHPGEVRRAVRESHERLKISVLAHYNNGIVRCFRCGESRLACLSIDHIKGGGAKHRKELGVKSGFNFYYWLRAHGYPEGYQTLCMNCQFIKRVEAQEY